MEFINNITLHSNLFCRQFLHLFSRRLRYFLQFLFLLFQLFDFLVHLFSKFFDFLPQSLKFLSMLLYYSRLYYEKRNIEIYNIMNIFTARKRSLRRSCFHRCLSVHWGCLPLDTGGVCPGDVCHPLGRHPPGQTPPLVRHHPQADGQQAGSTHRTGMQSCYLFILFCSVAGSL